MDTDRNSNLPHGPRADALGTLLFYLYEDILARRVNLLTTTTNFWRSDKPWRGLESVSVAANRAEGIIDIVFYLDDHTSIHAHSGLVPAWVADRMRMIWTECDQKDAERVLRMLEGR